MTYSRATHRSHILNLLIAARGGEVPLPKIADCAAQYNARIYELRRLGFLIKNRTKEVGGGQAQPTEKLSVPNKESTQAVSSGSLFGNLALLIRMEHRDDG
jgi:hypothetical protein